MRCFLLAVAQTSTLDRYSNNFSLFLLLEQFRPAAYPARLAVYCHTFFEVEEEERGLEYETRIVVTRDGADVSWATPVAIRPSGERHRVRTQGLEFPEPGLYRIGVEWRTKGSGEEGPWTREAASWPIRADPPMH